MSDFRNELIDALVKEIIGPSTNPEYIDKQTGEELLIAKVHGSPQARYGAAMLYPRKAPMELLPDDYEDAIEEEIIQRNEVPVVETDQEAKGLSEKGAGSDEEPVSLANQFKPSAMGFTVRFKSDVEKDKITLFFKTAWYEKGQGQKPKKKIVNDGKIESILIRNRNYENEKESPDQEQFKEFLSDYWIRRPLKIEPVTISLKEVVNTYEKILLQKDNASWLKLSVVNRTSTKEREEGFMTFTFTLINEIIATTDYAINSTNILFQNELKLETENLGLIAPYRERQSAVDSIEEDELKLLYRNKQIFAIGHGSAVVWESDKESDPDNISQIRTSVLPVYDMPQIASAAEHVELNMYNLSDLGDWHESLKSLKYLDAEYEIWVNETAEKAKTAPELERYRKAAVNNSEKCKRSLDRIKKGIEILSEAKEDSDVVKSFRWMNRAMLWQQQRSKTTLRKWNRTGNGKNVSYVLDGIGKNGEQKFESLEKFQQNPIKGRWRPFQLAFILMNIESIINSDSEERKIVDLIWFPTGGGKTEAYLGLTAFTIFYRRLKGNKIWNWDFYSGTTAIMRYTLRLLTTQQYERAASLICGCDYIRQENKGLGPESISIGLWVGGSSTPNKHSSTTQNSLGAVQQFRNLITDRNSDYNFIVMKCPCCSAQIGKLEQPSDGQKIKGLKKEDGPHGKVLFQCENVQCEYYNQPLPLHVVDEYIYDNPPTLLLGTVDKFAMITWNSEAGKLFGFRNNGGQWTRITPPELIIQDELHLIAGPLGTMVGLYESMVQTLCNNYHTTEPPFISQKILENFIPPKIVASSATISRAFEQVQGLYAINDKNELNIFPAQGLSFGDTWFSEEKPVSEKYPGRKYVGILAPGYPSMQTAIVRTYAAILQKAGELQDNTSIDYYWTLLGYFNSIRELGGASSLVYSDIRERLGQIHDRELTPKDNRRFVRKHTELTSRISSSEIPDVLKKLEKNFNPNNNQAFDICLATNMVATGVDISRLGLMVIHGQPKTTAEYIQASSRVGRDLPNGPGLILTLYSPSKPRDKSQYEQFYSYHNRIYSNVEPTSVTPFSISARQRGLHAVIIGLIRHFSSGPLRNSAVIHEDGEFDQLIEAFKLIIMKRCEIIDRDEKTFTEQLFDSRVSFWKRGFQSYGDAGNYGIIQNETYVPLMYSNGAEVRDNIKSKSLPTPTSMRGVDSESKIGIANTINEII